jgi:transcriptional regulator GlxA family with amidase domain
MPSPRSRCPRSRPAGRAVQLHRLRTSAGLLEVTDLPVDGIAARSGLGSAANLGQHLGRDAGTTPTAYRATYQGRGPRPANRPPA